MADQLLDLSPAACEALVQGLMSTQGVNAGQLVATLRALSARVQELEARAEGSMRHNVTLRERSQALERYAQHDQTCYADMPNHPPCTCGLAALLEPQP